jgi:hypothetical protein
VKPILRLAGLWAVLLCSTGCSHIPAAATGIDQQIRTQVANAYQRLTSTSHVAGTLKFDIAYGNRSIKTAAGTAWFSVPSQTAAAQLTTDDGRTLVVSRSGADVRGLAAELTKASPSAETTTLGKSPIDKLWEVRSPGTDPLQLTTLLRASTFPGTVAHVRPIVEQKDGRTLTLFDLTIDMRVLAKHVGAPDNTWVNAIAEQDQGGLVDLRVELADQKLASLATDLPVKDTQVGVTGGTAGTQQAQYLHAVTEFVIEGSS